MISGDARDFVKTTQEKYDIIIIDSNKPLYNQIIDTCIELLNPKGLIFSDDTLFLPLGYKDRLILNTIQLIFILFIPKTLQALQMWRFFIMAQG